MKVIFIFALMISSLAYSKELTNFNKDLIKDVQKDIAKDNDKYKAKSIGRGPASFGEVEIESATTDGRQIQQENKIDKNVRQLGNQKW